MPYLFSDQSSANSPIRLHNIEMLKSNGFVEGRLQCTSGNVHIRELKTKVQLVFGVKPNVSLSKDFANIGYAERYFNNLKPYLKTQS